MLLRCTEPDAVNAYDGFAGGVETTTVVEDLLVDARGRRVVDRQDRAVQAGRAAAWP